MPNTVDRNTLEAWIETQRSFLRNKLETDDSDDARMQRFLNGQLVMLAGLENYLEKAE